MVSFAGGGVDDAVGRANEKQDLEGLRTVIIVIAAVVIVGLIWAAVSLFSSMDQQVG